VVLAAVVIGAAAIAFLLMPRSSTLVVNVADTKGVALARADVTVDGTKRCDDTPCVIRELPPGDHEVKVSATGYEPAPPRSITVDGRRDVLADFQLAATKGTGFKVTGASGVRVAVDGKDLGGLPQERRDLTPGEHLLHFSGERYLPLDKKITVASGEIVDLGSVPLKVTKGRALLELATPGARVFLVNPTDRKEVPQLPMAIEFDATERWELQATKDGFQDFDERISFDDGQADKTIVITLTPASLAASTSSSPPRPKAPPRPDKPDKADPTSERGGPDDEAILKINSLPASSVVLDGKPIGPTPQPHVVVTPGSHTVTFINSELSLKKTITVDVKAGESKPAFAKLRD
jgi:serine/threonine-protein kinase